ncbi:MAG: DUF262 domain-containing protein, partial [Candidatus Methylumidiphilus sp.]
WRRRPLESVRTHSLPRLPPSLARFVSQSAPTTHVEKRQVIDGQQRLTTLQIFLSAFRDVCRKLECEELAKECEAFTLNKGMMADPRSEQFKVWPTQLDRPQFADVVLAMSREALENKHPLIRQKYARKDDPRPRMVEAYLYFYEQIHEYIQGTRTEKPIAFTIPIAERLDECFQALKNAFQVVVIDLEQDDDAQVIFETLNARGEPLLPADLLRNYIFLRAARHGESQENLYNQYWRRFDDHFWRVEVKQGRLNRPRSDLFMQHFLASRQTIDIPVKHLFAEYKFWLDKAKPFQSVQEELETLARQGDDFRRIIEPKKGDPIHSIVTFLDAFDIRTAYPMLLALLDATIEESEWVVISKTLESYLVRRAITGLTTKNYNRVFLSLTRNMKRDGFAHENFVKQLSEQTGESVIWPSDGEFKTAWLTSHIYRTLSPPKIVHLLKRLNERCFTNKMEVISVDASLTIEHILPQNWIEHWPLPDGSRGVSQQELLTFEQTHPRVIATRRRNELLQTLGNLTLVSRPLNSEMSNAPWKQKKPALLQNSLLPINHYLHSEDTWDEKAIERRGNELFNLAITLWPKS